MVIKVFVSRSKETIHMFHITEKTNGKCKLLFLSTLIRYFTRNMKTVSLYQKLRRELV